VEIEEAVDVGGSKAEIKPCLGAEEVLDDDSIVC
jgi:hypothetical protein